MFLFYYVWGFFFYLVFFFRNIIEYFYIKYNQTPLNLKRDFNNIPYFEKIFLVFFYKKNIFNNSIANLYTNDNLFNFRKKKFPLIFFFHLYFDKMDYKFKNLNLKQFIKFFSYFNRSPFFKNVFKNLKKCFFKNKVTLFLTYLILQKILYKRYYNLCSSIYFVKFDKNNLVKLNFLFFLFLLNSNKKYILYDLSKYTDWYEFNFKNGKKIIPTKILISKQNKQKTVNYKLNAMLQFKIIYKKYNFFYKKIFSKMCILYSNIYSLNFKFKNLSFFFFFNSSWKKKINFLYPVRFNESSISKFIDLNNVKNYLFFYIRKNRIFNKGRYSRNRQLYRTGVYWCLWLNIILVYGLYFLFYRFTFNFGYFWWGILFLVYSTIFSRVIKYNFYNVFYVFKELNMYLKWLGLIFSNIFSLFMNFLTFNYSFFKNNFFILNFLDFVIQYIKKISRNRFIYLWETMSYKDESFLRHESIMHWFNQVQKLLLY